MGGVLQRLRANSFKGVCALLLILVGWWFLSEQPAKQGAVEDSLPAPDVSVLEVIPAEANFEVQATGVTLARWSTDIHASVSGRVETLPDGLEPGSLLANGALMVALDDTAVRAELAAAEARLAQAELEQSRIENEQFVAKQVTRGKQLSAYGRFEPHLAAARAEVASAQAALTSARRRLSDCRVAAPFPAIVLEQWVTPGQWVSAGERLFRVAASESIDVKAELPAAEWARLSDLAVGSVASVVSPDNQVWPATVRYLSPTMDPTTRQRSLVLQVALPYARRAPLLADQQVRVRFAGAAEANVVSAPATALTADGQVWSLQDGLLQLEAIELLRERNETIWFRYLEAPRQPRLLVRFPLSSMLQGQRGKPVQADITRANGNPDRLDERIVTAPGAGP